MREGERERERDGERGKEREKEKERKRESQAFFFYWSLLINSFALCRSTTHSLSFMVCC